MGQPQRAIVVSDAIDHASIELRDHLLLSEHATAQPSQIRIIPLVLLYMGWVALGLWVLLKLTAIVVSC